MAIVEEVALYAALKEGRLGGAAIDMWWEHRTSAEPDRRPRGNRSDVLMTLHCSGFPDGTTERR